MTETEQTKGKVEFRPPAVKLVADVPGDDKMRDQLDDTKQNDGYPGSCSLIDPNIPANQ